LDVVLVAGVPVGDKDVVEILLDPSFDLDMVHVDSTCCPDVQDEEEGPVAFVEEEIENIHQEKRDSFPCQWECLGTTSRYEEIDSSGSDVEFPKE